MQVGQVAKNIAFVVPDFSDNPSIEFFTKFGLWSHHTRVIPQVLWFLSCAKSCEGEGCITTLIELNNRSLIKEKKKKDNDRRGNNKTQETKQKRVVLCLNHLTF